jgi:hypothetical protein
MLVMTLDYGSVGIGQPKPSAKLDVNACRVHRCVLRGDGAGRLAAVQRRRDSQ